MRVCESERGIWIDGEDEGCSGDVWCSWVGVVI